MGDAVDTIAAISTPLGEGAIAVIRMSGPRAREILERVFAPRRPGPLVPFQLRLGWIVDPENGRRLDQVLATWMPRGRSYTAEEMAEIQGHGGIAAVRAVLRLLLRQGARPAGPGEFTLRAFLNGRLSLTEAEAVLDLIRAPGEAGLEAAVRQLGGELTAWAEELWSRLRLVTAEVEASIDFPEDVGEGDRGRLAGELAELRERLGEILARAEQGRVVREGLRVVLVGRPNAGKSSLMNALLGRERAIVTPIPGTTRDVLEEALDWEGLPVRLFDTAGLGEVKDGAEELAVERAREAVRKADVLLLVVDGSQEADGGLAAEVGPERAVVVVNKADLFGSEVRERWEREFSGWPLVFCSALKGWGLEELREKVLELIIRRGIRPGESALVTRERQRRLLERCAEAVEEAQAGLRQGLPFEVVAVALQEAGDCLGELTGRRVREEVLEEIFSEFCVGK
ncbi:MAG: tRNA uridine-5-carboxymethylaminomethyl(34) synthesis GTPase MnmE [Moorellales bacterium]